MWSNVRSKYDIVHINVAPRGSTWRKMLFARAAKMRNSKIVLHLHGSGYDSYYRSLGSRQRSAVASFFKAADAVIVLGEYWRRFTVSDLEVDSERIHVIANGVPEYPHVSKAQDGPTQIVMMGVVGERKGVDVLLEALSKLPRDLPWICRIAGNGEVDRFSELRDQLGLGKQVLFEGWLSEEQGRDLLTRSDLFVLPSRQENQPLAILEAMAAGLPVVSTRIGAIPEQVQDGCTGRLVAPGDAEALSDAIRFFLVSRQARMDYGRAGLELFRERFSIEKCALLVAQLYSSVFDPKDASVAN